MYIYTSKEIKEIDQDAEKLGMSTFTLMENAGNALFRKISPKIKKGEKVLIVAGKGNNGGDGIVLARYLKNNGHDVKLTFPLGEPKTETAQKHLFYYQTIGYDISPFQYDEQADWIIDALLGVGSRLPLRNDLAKITNWINEQKGKVIAIDVPTGVASDSGDVDEHAVIADYTIALHGYKPSVFLFPSSTYYGKTEQASIGLQQTGKWRIWSEEDVKRTWKKHQRSNTHKGTFGNGLLVAGSDEMPGSAALAAIGAMRFGIGKLTVATTKHASTIIGSIVPEATFSYYLQKEEIAKKYSFVAIGPGLTPTEKLEEFIQSVLQQPIPVILDAGALQKRTYTKRTHPTIITPHPGEFSRLTNKTTSDIQKNRITFASQYAKENDLIVVLKGHYTVIAFPDGTGYVNVTGNRALSKGGTGDTLTGMLLASLGNHDDVKSAVANGVYIHGKVADEWVKEHGEKAMLAHDFNRLLTTVLCNE